MKNIFIGFVVTLISLPGWADKPELGEYVNEEIAATLSAFNEIEQDLTPMAPEEGWYQNTMRLRVRPIFGFEVKWLAKLELKPSIEFIWKRNNPVGYQAYTPKH